jgi:hypothetical protein
VVEGLAHPSLVPRQVPVGGGSEVSATAHRGRDPEPDGLAARREKDYEGGDGEEARGAGTGPHRREFRWDASTSKQAKKVRRGPAESVQVTAWFIRRARITLGQAFSWGGLFMVIVTEIRGLRLNQRDMGRIRWRGAALSKTLLGRLQKFFSRSAFSVCCAVSL